MRCGLTPTDFMHIKGDYNLYDREASVLASEYILCCMGKKDITEEDVLALADTAYDLVCHKMYSCIVKTLLSKQYPKQFGEGTDDQVSFMIDEAWKNRNNAGKNLIDTLLSTQFVLIGIGAPIGLFLPAVGEALKTRCIIPQHSEVANAIGALNANVRAIFKIDISQRLSNIGKKFYIAHLPTGSEVFDELEDAVAAAKASGSLDEDYIEKYESSIAMYKLTVKCLRDL